jgi:hypothetical protein
MSKEDRYSHLGENVEASTDGTDAADGRAATDAESATLTVTLDDGEEETVLTFDPDEVSAAELRAAIESAPEGPGGRSSPSLTGGDPGRLALELGTLGPRLALKSVESLVDGLNIERDRSDRD